ALGIVIGSSLAILANPPAVGIGAIIDGSSTHNAVKICLSRESFRICKRPFGFSATLDFRSRTNEIKQIAVFCLFRFFYAAARLALKKIVGDLLLGHLRGHTDFG